MKVHILGMGPGTPGMLTGQAKEALCAADAVIGAERLFCALPDACGAVRIVAVRPDEIARWIGENTEKERVCVLVSGDAGFYSGAKKLLPLLVGHEVFVVPGLSSVQYFAAKLRRPWQDWKLISAHGADCDAASLVRDHAETFFLTGGARTVRALCMRLCEAGLGGCAVTVGENLGCAEERIKTGTAAEFSRIDHGALAVLLADNPCPRDAVSCGFPDDAFSRGDLPMTKSEVRSVILSKLKLRATDVVYDIGAGTGSVAVEAALLARRGHVYAVEREPEGCRLIRENAKKFSAFNLTCVEGEAPDAFSDLPAPDAAFVGGSGGKLTEILGRLLQKNPSVRLVVSAVALETIAEATAALERLPVRDVEIVQVAVSRAKRLGAHRLMLAQNAVFIVSGVGGHD